MMQTIYVGIDVAKDNLNIHVTEPPSDGVIPNRRDAIERFITHHALIPSAHIIGAESTGRYHLKAQEVFVEKGFTFKLLNPILTGKKIATSIRKKKTDVSDAALIAALLQQGEGRVITPEQLSTTKRSVLRARKTVVEHTTALKVLVQDLKRDTNVDALSSAIMSLTALIATMEGTVKELGSHAEDCPAHTVTEQLIRTVPGFATTLAGVVSSEVGDFNRFPSSTQFKAYVGIDPKVTQSGGTLITGHITKRGNVHLRSAFYLAAQVARCHDPELKAFYQKKIGEGKPVRVAIVAVARKLCERVYAVVTKGVPYQIKQPSFS